MNLNDNDSYDLNWSDVFWLLVIFSLEGELSADSNRMHFIIIPRKFNNQKSEKVVIFRKNKE